jgi:uncharacterized protein YbjT (DUF2867 family)
MSKPLITIFGATGAQGGGLARALLADRRREFRVRAATRQPGHLAAQALAELGAEITLADLDDPASVQRAMHGAHGAFCVTALHTPVDRERAQAATMVQAARREAVRHVVWAHYDAASDASAQLSAPGLPVTCLHTAFHWDNFTRPGAWIQRAPDGTLQLLLPMGELPGVAAADVGACALGVFLQGQALQGQRIGVVGEQLTATRLACELATALGEPVRAVTARDNAPGSATLERLFRAQREFQDAHGALHGVEASRALHPGLQTFERWLTGAAPHLAVPPREPA